MRKGQRKPNRCETIGQTSTIYIRHAGREVDCLVDSADLESVSGRTWTLNTERYAVNSASKKLMHRLLVDVPAGMVTDHINGNRLDNRRSNLRVVTESVNGHNRKAWNRGVSWNAIAKKWRVRFCIEGKPRAFGSYVSEAVADAVASLIREKLRRGETV